MIMSMRKKNDSLLSYIIKSCLILKKRDYKYVYNLNKGYLNIIFKIYRKQAYTGSVNL